jgi:ribA/ribD-fused uncharacterized protein
MAHNCMGDTIMRASTATEASEDTGDTITAFRGDFFFLSNFYPCAVTVEGMTYPSSEHAFQAMKTLDSVERAQVCDAASPILARRKGKKVTLRPEWETYRFTAMEMVLRAKFSDPELARKLAATGDRELIEGNTWRDTTWGAIKTKDGTWKGQNRLGKLLMALRTEKRNHDLAVKRKPGG